MNSTSNTTNFNNSISTSTPFLILSISFSLLLSTTLLNIFLLLTKSTTPTSTTPNSFKDRIPFILIFLSILSLTCSGIAGLAGLSNISNNSLAGSVLGFLAVLFLDSYLTSLVMLRMKSSRRITPLSILLVVIILLSSILHLILISDNSIGYTIPALRALIHIGFDILISVLLLKKVDNVQGVVNVLKERNSDLNLSPSENRSPVEFVNPKRLKLFNSTFIPFSTFLSILIPQSISILLFLLSILLPLSYDYTKVELNNYQISKTILGIQTSPVGYLLICGLTLMRWTSVVLSTSLIPKSLNSTLSHTNCLDISTSTIIHHRSPNSVNLDLRPQYLQQLTNSYIQSHRHSISASRSLLSPSISSSINQHYQSSNTRVPFDDLTCIDLNEITSSSTTSQQYHTYSRSQSNSTLSHEYHTPYISHREVGQIERIRAAKDGFITPPTRNLSPDLRKIEGKFSTLELNEVAGENTERTKQDEMVPQENYFDERLMEGILNTTVDYSPPISLKTYSKSCPNSPDSTSIPLPKSLSQSLPITPIPISNFNSFEARTFNRPPPLILSKSKLQNHKLEFSQSSSTTSSTSSFTAFDPFPAPKSKTISINSTLSLQPTFPVVSNPTSNSSPESNSTSSTIRPSTTNSLQITSIKIPSSPSPLIKTSGIGSNSNSPTTGISGTKSWKNMKLMSRSIKKSSSLGSIKNGISGNNTGSGSGIRFSTSSDESFTCIGDLELQKLKTKRSSGGNNDNNNKENENFSSLMERGELFNNIGGGVEKEKLKDEVILEDELPPVLAPISPGLKGFRLSTNGIIITRKKSWFNSLRPLSPILSSTSEISEEDLEAQLNSNDGRSGSSRMRLNPTRTESSLSILSLQSSKLIPLSRYSTSSMGIHNSKTNSIISLEGTHRISGLSTFNSNSTSSSKNTLVTRSMSSLRETSNYNRSNCSSPRFGESSFSNPSSRFIRSSQSGLSSPLASNFTPLAEKVINENENRSNDDSSVKYEYDESKKVSGNSWELEIPPSLTHSNPSTPSSTPLTPSFSNFQSINSRRISTGSVLPYIPSTNSIQQQKQQQLLLKKKKRLTFPHPLLPFSQQQSNSIRSFATILSSNQQLSLPNTPTTPNYNFPLFSGEFIVEEEVPSTPIRFEDFGEGNFGEENFPNFEKKRIMRI